MVTTWSWFAAFSPLLLAIAKNEQGVQESPTEELLQQRRAQWQWMWLGQVGNSLPSAWQSYYEELVKTFGSEQAPSDEERWPQRRWPDAFSIEVYKALPLINLLRNSIYRLLNLERARLDSHRYSPP